MWHIPIVVIAGVGGFVTKKIIDSRKSNNNTTSSLTILDLNMIALSSVLDEVINHKKIAVLGQPGSGKSSLIDSLTRKSCVIRPLIGQQTDMTNWSETIQTNFLYQYQNLAFVDVPGYDTFSHPISSFKDFFPFEKFDYFIFVVNGKIHKSDDEIWNLLKYLSLQRKTIIVRNFAENLTKEDEFEIKEDLKSRFGKEPIFVSNRYQTGINEITNILQKGTDFVKNS